MCKRGTMLQLAELEKSDELFLTPDQVAPVIGCDPQSIRGACETVEGYQRIGFPVTRLGARTYIPRLAFIRWLKGELVLGNQLPPQKGDF